jgi:hypothetical protein
VQAVPLPGPPCRRAPRCRTTARPSPVVHVRPERSQSVRCPAPDPRRTITRPLPRRSGEPPWAPMRVAACSASSVARACRAASLPAVIAVSPRCCFARSRTRADSAEKTGWIDSRSTPMAPAGHE